MGPIELNVGALPVEGNSWPAEIYKAILDKLTEDQRKILYNANLHWDVEIRYSRADGRPGNFNSFYSYSRRS